MMHFFLLRGVLFGSPNSTFICSTVTFHNPLWPTCQKVCTPLEIVYVDVIVHVYVSIYLINIFDLDLTLLSLHMCKYRETKPNSTSNQKCKSNQSCKQHLRIWAAGAIVAAAMVDVDPRWPRHVPSPAGDPWRSRHPPTPGVPPETCKQPCCPILSVMEYGKGGKAVFQKSINTFTL